jgi:hypothetical protein
MAQVWAELSDEKMIDARGRTAIRGLITLLNRLANLERRVTQYLERQNTNNLDKEVVRTYFEEVVENYNSLQEDVLSSIEDWADLIPEADIRSEIGVITELKSRVIQREGGMVHFESEIG